MPLSVKVRVEVYLPDLPTIVCQDLLKTFAEEFTFTFGGCTIVRGLDGNYLSKFGQIISDRINLIYTDIPLELQENLSSISKYSDQLRIAAFDVLDEEATLIVVWQIYHSV